MFRTLSFKKVNACVKYLFLINTTIIKYIRLFMLYKKAFEYYTECKL